MKTQQFLITLAAMCGAMYPTVASASGSQTAARPVAGSPQPSDPSSLTQASAVVGFWREAGPGRWFVKDDEFDASFRERFLSLYEAAAGGELAKWLEAADGALALVLLLDQFPRNAFRGTPRMYATDALAREAAKIALDAGHDRAVEAQLQFSSTCRSVTQRTWPTRIDRLRSLRGSDSLTCPMPSSTATSSAGTDGFRIEMRFLDVLCGQRSSNFSTKEDLPVKTETRECEHLQQA